MRTMRGTGRDHEHDGTGRRRAAMVVAVAAIVLVLAACGDDDADDASGDAATTTTTIALQPFGPAPTLANQGDVGPDWFVLPSKNIACAVEATGLRCDIAQHKWEPAAEKPATCELDWGGGLELAGAAPQFVCAGDTLLSAPQTLAYGKASQRGAYRCESSTQGITCQNLETRHGFLLSREVYSIF